MMWDKSHAIFSLCIGHERPMAEVRKHEEAV
jgi:hypothetical protein